VQTTKNRRHPFDYLFPFGCLLFAVVLLVGLMAGCTNDGDQVVMPAHTYDMACYDHMAPLSEPVLVGMTIEADLCSVENGPASGGFVVRCFEDRSRVTSSGLNRLHAAYLCVSFEQTR